MREILCLIAAIGAMAWFLPESDIQKNSANPYRASIYEETLRDVSKGVFISEHMGEVETFIGQLLTEAIERHGKVPEEKQLFFSDWALEQLEEMEWEADPYFYERHYTVNFFFGNIGYDFFYSFYMDAGTLQGNQADPVNVQVSVDGNGIIRGVNVDLESITDENSNAAGRFQDKFQEIVVEEGIEHAGKVVYSEKGKGVLVTGDAAMDAGELGKLIIKFVENGNAEEYKHLFEDEKSFQDFKNEKWSQLDEGWKANRYFDCYYTYVTREKGYVEFLYYIYPDYDGMKRQEAKALTLKCIVGTADGKIQDTVLRVYSMTQEEYHSVREWKGRQVVLVENGEIIGGGGIIWIPGQEHEHEAEKINTYKDMGDSQLADILMDALNTGNIADGRLTDFIKDKESIQLSDIASEIQASTAGGWKLGEKYDFYYINYNEQAGRIHYRYHFYWDKPDVEEEKVLVMDAWISLKGIEDLQIHWFTTQKSAAADHVSETGEKTAGNIGTFLRHDWTTDNVLLLDHSITPQDSAQGWKFALADVDFDGMQELLMIFTSNHCGTNSLYIYRQENGRIVSYIDTIATPQNHIGNEIDYREISPYMDIALMDAYVNEKNEYRYLSLDNSLFGGDIHGGIYTVVLYETVLEEDAVPEEIVRITYCAPEEKEEVYFLGEKVYEAGKLKDLLADYMEGYEKVKIDYKMADKEFQRDIVMLSDEEKMQELMELYDSLEKCCK